ncbi:MAG: hypothetical protein QXS16_02340 [Pyrobaculum sp.]
MIICPVCGKTGYLTREKRGSRRYLYVVHVERIGKKRVKTKCYLGPADGYIINRSFVARIQRLDADTLYSMLSDEQKHRLAEMLTRHEMLTRQKQHPPS